MRDEARGGFGWGAVLRQAGWLLLAVVLATALSWYLHPDGLPLRADPSYYELELSASLVSPGRALELYEAGDHVFVDTRPTAGLGTLTIPGAVLIREASFDDDLLELFDFILPEDPLVLFGGGNLTGPSNIAGRLEERGYSNLAILQGGLLAWSEAGGPLSSGNSGSEEGP